MTCPFCCGCGPGVGGRDAVRVQHEGGLACGPGNRLYLWFGLIRDGVGYGLAADS